MVVPSKNFINFRKEYPCFSYERFFWKVLGNNLKISFDFGAGENISFSPQVLIKKIDPKRIKKVGKKTIDNLVFNLGMIEMLSYWKATCSPKIMIRAGHLNKDQLKWWKDLVINGMGQYFYENQINFLKKDFLKIESDKKAKTFRPIKLKLKKRYLVPMGGGKDSIVTAEILKGAGHEFNCFCLNPTAAAKKVIGISGCKHPLTIVRKLDPNLLKLNEQGFLNGHTPFTAYLSFLSALGAVLFDFQLIAFSNEQSANEGNVWYFGREINHQHSKSFKFENKFRDYLDKYMVKGLEYFSFLRPLFELQIAKIFSRYPVYFKSFLSCNQGVKKQVWCGHCPKCLFVFTALFSFLDKKQIKEIFGQDFFSKPGFLTTMKELVGLSSFKPFECVGTKKESMIAFYLATKKAREAGKLPFLLSYFKNRISTRYFNLESESRRILVSYNKKHNLPAELKRMLRDKVYID